MKKKYVTDSNRFSGFSKAFQKLVILLFFVFFSVFNVQGQVTVAGALTGNGDYPTLGDAFTAIGTSQTAANITITIRGNTTETTTAIINAGDWESVLITPSGGAWTVTGALAGGLELIRFNGADNVTINGLNSGGNSLTISNTSTSNTSGTSTIKYMADATNNTITNCNLLGSATVGLGSMGGVVFFSNSANTTGNNNNTISNCNIGPAGGNLPSKLIFSSGNSSVPLYNSRITITGCNLYDYFSTSGAAAIYVASGNTEWTITNNKIYQSATRNFSSAATFYGIYFGNPTSSTNIQINGNTIGYANNSGTGTLTLTSNAGINGAFIGIYYFGSTTAPDVCSISNNTVSNISLTSAAGSLQGIYNTTGASSNSINLNGNTVRNLTAVNTTNSLVGIYAGAATTLDCSNNNISNLSRNAAGHFYGIIYATATNVTFDSNTITNLNTTAADNGTSNFAGIFSISTPQTEKFFNNTITGLTSASTTSGIKFFGINNGTNATGNKIFIGNTISGLSLPATGTGTIYGIKLNGGGTQNNILGNTIHTISGGNGIIGIGITTGTTNDVSKNKIYGLSSPSVGAVIYGMSLTGGATHNVYNNILGNLNAPAGDNAVSSPNQVIGINATNGISTLNLYHNTIKIDASSTGANFGSSAVSVDTNPILTMRNNILVNSSVANGTGLSAVLRKPVLTSYDASSNNNLFYGAAIYTDGTNTDMTLTDFRTRLANRDGLSVSENPNFTSTTGSDATYLHINTTVPTQIDNGGANIASVTDDFDGNARNATTPDIGADEFTIASAICGTAVGGTNTPAVTTICTSGNTMISATGFTVANGITYQWESASDAAFTSPVNEGAATTTYANLTTPTITATTYYRLKVTCSAGMSSYSNVSSVMVTSPTTPSFSQVAAICSGSTLSPLPTTSNNGIAGTWSPALNNMSTTTYTFIPNAGQCGTNTTMTITVNPATMPTFTQVAAICSGSTLSALPTTSNNGIAGTWSPALNNTSTTTYTFIPNAGQCGTNATMTITVNPATMPTFTQVAAICSGSTLSTLPTTSNNGIAGTWSPALNNMSTTTYTFTPNAGLCAATTTMTITVNTTAAPTGPSNQNMGSIQTVGDIVVNGTGIVWYASAADAANGVSPLNPSTPINNGVYYATQSIGGCRSTSSLAVTVTIVLGNNDFHFNEFKYYPNPVSAILNVENAQAISSVEVYTVTGQKVGQKYGSEVKTTFDMSGLPAGTYLVKVISNNEVKTIKVVKK